MIITKPMLAATIEDTSCLTFPLWGTPKLDGIRCLKQDKRVLTRKFLRIPNLYTHDQVKKKCPDGLDGELVLPGKTFNEIQSAIMSEDGEPDFRYAVFDYIHNSLTTPYVIRMNQLHMLKVPDFVEKIIPVEIRDMDALHEFEEKCVQLKYEGIMLRTGDSPYKCGRSTLRQQWLMKLKRFVDSEAIIIGFKERLHNENEATIDEQGHTKRSGHKANKTPMNTLGSLHCRDIKTKVEFYLGTGIDDDLRKEIWDNQKKYLGRILTYQTQIHGMKNKPRIPSFKGFRKD